MEKVVGHMEEKLTGNELEMLYAAADYRRVRIFMKGDHSITSIEIG
nr:Hha/YmoA family nucleoid-associated regulatory protein [Klebsiella pneumoniae]